MMDEKTKELIAIGASVAANCRPCLTFHVDKADELDIGEADIREALAIGTQVQKGGMNAMQRFIEQSFGPGSDDAEPEPMISQKKKAALLTVYDPPMCCSTGVCGTSVSDELIAFAGLLRKAEAKGIEVNRYNLARQPRAFTENAAVREAMTGPGQEGLPLVFVDNKLVVSGRYPAGNELLDLLGIDETDAAEDSGKKTGPADNLIPLTGGTASDSGECSPGGGCC